MTILLHMVYDKIFNFVEINDSKEIFNTLIKNCIIFNKLRSNNLYDTKFNILI